MEDISFALQVFLLGFSVVIITLFGLFLILILFNYLFYKPLVKPADVRSAPESQPLQVKSFPEENPRVVAAILAAVYQYMQVEKEHSFAGPISIAVQPASRDRGSGWKYIGRKEMLEKSLELERIRREKKRKQGTP